MSVSSLRNGKKLLLSIASKAAKDQKLAPLSGGGAAANAARAAPKMMPNRRSTKAFQEEPFGAVVDLIVPCLSRNCFNFPQYCSCAPSLCNLFIGLEHASCSFSNALWMSSVASDFVFMG